MLSMVTRHAMSNTLLSPLDSSELMTGQYAEYVRLQDTTRGQSNLTKSASRGPIRIPRLGVTPGGRKLYH